MKIIVISLNNKSNYAFETISKNFEIFPAVDLRNSDLNKLLSENKITYSAYFALKNGRKHHYEPAGKGAIGLYESYKKILNSVKDTKENVLICEEDCTIVDKQKFLDAIEELKNYDFDCAPTGSIILNDHYDNTNIIDKIVNKKQNHYKKFYGNFILLHCVIWSPKGIKKMLKYINKPFDIQLDWYISLLCNQNLLNVYINTDNTIAKQILHLSDLNNHKECFLCDKSPNSEKIIPYSTKETTLIAIITIFVIIYLIK